MLALAALIVGLVIGLFWNVSIPPRFAIYVALLILVLIDRVLQAGSRIAASKHLMWQQLLGGFIADLVLASLLTGLGQRLGVPLYLAPIFALGNRIFRRFAALQIYVFRSLEKEQEMGEEQEKAAKNTEEGEE